MTHFLLLVALCLLSYGECQRVTSVAPTTVPTLGGTKIIITGTGFSSTDTYGCYFQGSSRSAMFISSTQLMCTTPAVSYPEDITLSILLGTSTFATVPFHFINTDSCFKPQVRCDVWGDPHFVPFCDRANTYTMQPSNTVLNLVTSKDNRFIVRGKTTALYLNSGLNVCNLNQVSVIGPGTDGQLSEKITFDSTTSGTVKVYYGGVLRTDLPVTINGVYISRFTGSWVWVTFPGGEIVNWNGKEAVVIYLPGIQYWRNVDGLCGQLDARNPYCVGGNGNKYLSTNPYVDYCADTWTVSSLKRFDQESNFILDNDTFIDNDTFSENGTIYHLNDTIPYQIPPTANVSGLNSTAYVVSDNFLSRAAESICVELFEFLSSVCPENSSQNLGSYETTCIYDGAALLTSTFNQLLPSTDIDSISDVKSFIKNLAVLAETILDGDTWAFMVSSVRAGIQDCFYQNATTNLNATQPEFDVDAFLSSLPTCSSYCKIKGASCSDDDECEFSLTLAELINWNSAIPSIHLNVVLFVGCLLLLSIW